MLKVRGRVSLGNMKLTTGQIHFLLDRVRQVFE